MRSPETNGFCERFHRTLKEEFFATLFRKTLYESLEQLQADLDGYLEFDNRQRAHQGYRTRGRTPYKANGRERTTGPGADLIAGNSRELNCRNGGDQRR